jgi:release factor glutamine methyltransferase
MSQTVNQLIVELRKILKPVIGPQESEASIRIIMEHLKGWTPVDLVIRRDDDISDFIAQKAIDIATRIANDEPIQYILGTARFMGNDFKVTPATLIPRPETAQLVDMIVSDYDNQRDLNVLDIGTGTGCIAISLARALKFANVSALDVSSEALEVAHENANSLKVNVEFIHADILSYSADNCATKYNIIVSNPPYIAQFEEAQMESRVTEHEPHSALFVPDENPLIFYKAIAQFGKCALVNKGRLYFEINPLFTKELTQELAKLGYRDILVHRDFCGKNRFITAIYEN